MAHDTSGESGTPECDAWYAAHQQTLDTPGDAAYAREFGDFARSLELRLTAARAEAEALRAEKDAAYLQRNHLVAALSRLFPAGIRYTDIPGWSADWHGCCMIDLPSGQVSYHFHDSHLPLFAHLQTYKGEWDGHDKDAVHIRLAALTASEARNG